VDIATLEVGVFAEICHIDVFFVRFSNCTEVELEPVIKICKWNDSRISKDEVLLVESKTDLDCGIESRGWKRLETAQEVWTSKNNQLAVDDQAEICDVLIRMVV